MLLEKLINQKHFLVKNKFGLVFRKVFSFFSGRKYFSKVVKKLKTSYYLLIITNLILKLLIAIYFVLNFFSSISLLRIWLNLIFILTLVLIFMIVICFSLIIFLIAIFYLSNLVLIFWLLLILFVIIYEIVGTIILISSSFNFLSFKFDLHYFNCYLFYLR
jgi:hypothetical protein